jgi:hypothetical protein
VIDFGGIKFFPEEAEQVPDAHPAVRPEAALLAVVKKFVATSPVVTEFQLFWLAKLCQDILLGTPGAGDLMVSLLRHPAATAMSKGRS